MIKTGASAPASDTKSSTTDYKSMLDTLETAIEEAQRKVESGRVYDVGKEKVRIK